MIFPPPISFATWLAYIRQSHTAAWDREYSEPCSSHKGRRDCSDRASLRLAAPRRQAETHLKVHGDWGPSPLLLVISGQQLDLCTDLGFLHSSHTFYPTRGNPEVRRCPSLISPPLQVHGAARSTEHSFLPRPCPQHAHLLPHNGILTGLVLRLPFHADDLHSTGVEGCWDPDLEGRTW